jgi:cell division transport system permease protein
MAAFTTTDEGNVSRLETIFPKSSRSAVPVLPRETVAGSTLVAVIAIMSFLAALTVGAVRIAQISVQEWRGELANEMTIQVKPAEGHNLDVDVKNILETVQRISGIAEARVYTKEESEKLLAPWLGSNLDLGSLPVPRLIRLKLGDQASIPALRAVLDTIPNATLNDHRAFAARLAAISKTATLAGFAILILVLLATVLSVSFATRGAVAASRPTVEVLHFIGARNAYIANLFQRHFFRVGFKGALLGGAVAALLFILFRFSGRLFGVFSGPSDTAFLLTSFNLDWRGYIEIAAAVFLTALVTALGSRFTVISTLRNID